MSFLCQCSLCSFIFCMNGAKRTTVSLQGSDLQSYITGANATMILFIGVVYRDVYFLLGEMGIGNTFTNQ